MNINTTLCLIVFLVWAFIVINDLRTIEKDVKVFIMRVFIIMGSLPFVFALGCFAGAFVILISVLPLASLFYSSEPQWLLDVTEYTAFIAGNALVWISWKWWIREKQQSSVDTTLLVGRGQVKKRRENPNSVFQRKFH